MIYARGFFDLQLRFAHRVATLSGLPRERALLEYTNLYIRFGLGRDFDPAHPVWRQYLAGLPEAGDGGEWTYRFYRARPEVVGPPGIVATFGCFAYARSGSDRIRLHFRNAEADGHSPLSRDCRDRRVAELTALFAHVKQTVPLPLRVAGTSWLYNLEAYRRLFPSSYLATARAVDGRFQHMPLWGQFLDRYGEVKPSVAGPFLARLARQSSLDDVGRCFPFRVLAVEASVLEFSRFYGIPSGGLPPRQESDARRAADGEGGGMSPDGQPSTPAFRKASISSAE